MTPEGTRGALTLVLVVTSGATDAVGFLALGGAFTSVMTGNLVLLGVAAGDADVALAIHTITAISSFVFGAWLGAVVSATGSRVGDDPVWPRGVTRALWVELAFLSAFAFWWWTIGPAERHVVSVALMLNATALGIQSSAVRRFGVAGLSTTYLTGTLTALVGALTSREESAGLRHSAALLAGLVSGAAAGAMLCRQAPAWVPVLLLSTLLVVLVSVRPLMSRAHALVGAAQPASTPVA